MCTLQDTFITMFYTSLDKFCNLIDDNYENKEQLKIECKKIKEKLSYTAPEIITKEFGFQLNRLTPMIPQEENIEWIEKGWGIIMEAYHDGVKLTNKQYPNEN